MLTIPTVPSPARRDARPDRAPRPGHPIRRAGRGAAALLVLALLASGCGSGDDTGGTTTETTAEPGMSVSVASYDVSVSAEPRRLLLGLQTPDQRLVTHGAVDLAFTYLGDREQQADNAEPSITTTGEYLPIPGSPDPGEGETPRLSAPSEARGVYGGQVTFDQAGFWSVAVTAAVDGSEPLSGTASFEVLAENQVPDVGDPALETENLTIASVESGEAEPVAVDSRAQDGGQVPDPELHDSTIAEGIAAGRPVVALFATPVYCVSQFCGPITDMVAELAPQYADKVDFVHVEIWSDHDNQAVNRAAADWLLRNDNLQEPYMFVIGADGTISHRFDNVTTRGELEAALKEVTGTA